MSPRTLAKVRRNARGLEAAHHQTGFDQCQHIQRASRGLPLLPMRYPRRRSSATNRLTLRGWKHRISAASSRLMKSTGSGAALAGFPGVAR